MHETVNRLKLIKLKEVYVCCQHSFSFLQYLLNAKKKKKKKNCHYPSHRTNLARNKRGKNKITHEIKKLRGLKKKKQFLIFSWKPLLVPKDNAERMHHFYSVTVSIFFFFFDSFSIAFSLLFQNPKNILKKKLNWFHLKLFIK